MNNIVSYNATWWLISLVIVIFTASSLHLLKRFEVFETNTYMVLDHDVEEMPLQWQENLKSLLCP
ncbi:hypothetical protein [uncultured Vibrio sp.]|uniref:hypothetical protein n=1 Tax=uncultured Vibrio sp. TaxID=114054 RepID=UPI0009114A70|nr:hypothetical protein [uncultured Vibrio sp.]OIQ26415.1 MAG: hypothetical protein BM561_01235 [Vibrio sp. MedPE-SWchi]